METHIVNSMEAVAEKMSVAATWDGVVVGSMAKDKCEGLWETLRTLLESAGLSYVDYKRFMIMEAKSTYPYFFVSWKHGDTRDYLYTLININEPTKSVMIIPVIPDMPFKRGEFLQ